MSWAYTGCPDAGPPEPEAKSMLSIRLREAWRHDYGAARHGWCERCHAFGVVFWYRDQYFCGWCCDAKRQGK